VILAEDGFDALAKISDYRPTVIFVDIMMPRLDGYQTCALIKQNPNLKSTPVIMLSSKDGVFDRARGRLAAPTVPDQAFTKEGCSRRSAAREAERRCRTTSTREKGHPCHQERPRRRRLADRPPVPERHPDQERFKVSTAESAEDALVKVKQARPTSC
jgi:twitching motility two-component system response regulator PilG